MAFDLFGEVVDGDCDVGDAVGSQEVGVVVDDRFSGYFEEWFGAGECGGPESFAFASCHDDG